MNNGNGSIGNELKTASWNVRRSRAESPTITDFRTLPHIAYELFANVKENIVECK